MLGVLRTLIFAFAIGFAGAPAFAFAAERLPPVHVVFDIDWTLVSQIPETNVARYAGDPRLIEIERLYYRLSNGTEAAINRLLDFNRQLGYDYVKISFFSGGGRSRNEGLLKKIILDPATGKSALDIAEKVLSFENLEDHFPDLAKNDHVAFADRYQKNLIEFFDDLARTIAIDDTTKFFRGDQIKSLLAIGETYSDFQSFADAIAANRKDPLLKYVPTEVLDWFADQNRILLAALQIEYALKSELEAAKRGRAERLPFRERVQAVHAKFTKSELIARIRQVFAKNVAPICNALHSPVK